jgi:hypothetical protein
MIPRREFITLLGGTGRVAARGAGVLATAGADCRSQYESKY